MRFKSFILMSLIVMIAISSGYSLKKVGSRQVPTANDFISDGAGPRYSMAESLFVEFAYLLPTLKRISSTWRACSLNTIWADSIRELGVVTTAAGGVDIDTVKNLDRIVGSTSISAALAVGGTITADTLIGAMTAKDSLRVGGSGSFIRQMWIDGDSLKIDFEGTTYHWLKD